LRNRREPKLRNIPTFPVQKLYLGSMHSHTTTNLFQFLNAANFPCQRNFPPIFCQYSRSKMLIETKMQPTTHVQRRPLKNEGRFFPMSINICTRETSLEFLETRSKESVSKRMLLMVQHSSQQCMDGHCKTVCMTCKNRIACCLIRISTPWKVNFFLCM
jgi:hypothetical protein